MARTWHLRKRPAGGKLDDGVFELRETPPVPLAEGEVRVRNVWLTVDPYMRGLLDGHGSYMPALPLGSALFGGAVGEVVESRAAGVPVGATVQHDIGWRDETVVAGEACLILDEPGIAPQLYLGHLGMPGQTAYFGLLAAGRAKAGQVLFVSAAAGGVGTAVVQIAKIQGLTVIASAGGADKCALLKELGADAVIDRRAPGTMREKLAQAAPDGIDLYFDNVGGDHLDAALESLHIGGRVALCGMVSGYEAGNVLELPDPMRLVVKQITMEGFTAPSYNDRREEFRRDMHDWVRRGLLRSPETVQHGLEAMPGALGDVLAGGNAGKMLVKL